MFLCVNCGNNIQSSNTQFKILTRKYKITGCCRWRYYIKCDGCNKSNDYKYFINHKMLFTPTLCIFNSLYMDIYSR
jgi:hypothetical protein